MSNEFSNPKLIPADDVKIPAVDGSNDTGYLLGEEVSQYIGSPLSGETDEYSTLESYSVGDTVIYENALYECTTATSGVFDPSDWKKITLKQLMTDLNSALSSITSLSTNKLSIADLASSLGQETNTAPTNKAVDDAITSLGTYLGGMLVVERVNPSTFSVNGNASYSASKSVAKTGYTALGIVGNAVSTGNLVLLEVIPDVENQTITFSVWNKSSSSLSGVGIGLYVLYVKNMS